MRLLLFKADALWMLRVHSEAAVCSSVTFMSPLQILRCLRPAEMNFPDMLWYPCRYSFFWLDSCTKTELDFSHQPLAGNPNAHLSSLAASLHHASRGIIGPLVGTQPWTKIQAFQTRVRPWRFSVLAGHFCAQSRNRHPYCKLVPVS